MDVIPEECFVPFFQTDSQKGGYVQVQPSKKRRKKKKERKTEQTTI